MCEHDRLNELVIAVYSSLGDERVNSPSLDTRVRQGSWGGDGQLTGISNN